MQSLRWYLNRLQRMSPAEVGYRMGKTLRTSAARLGALRHQHVPPPVIGGEPPPFVHVPEHCDRARYLDAAGRIMAGEYSIFDLESCRLGSPPDWNTDPLTGRRAPLVYAPGLDYRDERIVGDIKYLWEPNRHLHVVTLAQAYALTRDEKFADEIGRHLESWIAQCPYPCGPNWASPLELGIRLINWSIAWQLLGGGQSSLFSSGRGRAFRDAWLRTIYLHARAIVANLSRFSSANNHLIGEAAGVWIASVTWPYWRRMSEWGRRCRAILAREALLQNAEDGGNREQALSYQQFVLDFLLLSGLAGRARGVDFDVAYWARLERMIDFIACMMDAGGNVPLIGDADDGYVVRVSQEAGFCPYRSLIATGAVLFERPDLAGKAREIDHKTRWLLGDEAVARFERLAAATVPFVPRRELAWSGYYVLGNHFERADEIRLIVDCGPLGYLSIAAHGHADALSMVLSVGGVEILIDPGTYCYHTRPEWRRYFRGSRAHNTVVVDGEDQSVQSGNFMWSRHAQARCVEFRMVDGVQRFAGEHDGYARLSDPVTHRRAIALHESSREIEIVDVLRCASRHTVERMWHLSERVASAMRDSACVVEAGRFEVIIEPLEPIEWTRVITGGTPLEGGWISRAFARKQPCTTLCWGQSIEGETSLRTRIRCVERSR